MRETKSENLPETTIPERLKKLRKEKGISQEKIALWLGIKRDTYGKYEQGANDIPVCVVKDLAKFYKVTTDYIILGKTTPPSDTVISHLEKLPNDQRDIVLNAMVKMFEDVFPIIQKCE